MYSDNNNNNNKLPVLPNYLHKFILLIICKHINSIYKSLDSSNIDYKNELVNNRLVSRMSLVNKQWFNVLSSNLKVSIGFNYDQNLCKSIQSQIDAQKYSFNPSLVENAKNNNAQYYLYKLENITTIKLDFYSHYQNSQWNVSSILKREPHQKIMFQNQYVKCKLGELPNLKRIIFRACYSKKKNSINSEQLPIELFNNYEIRVSDVSINDRDFDKNHLIKRVNSAIIIGYNEDLIYNKMKYFNKYLKKLYVFSDTGPFKELAGISNSNDQDQNIINNKLRAPPKSIDYNTNYLVNLQQISLKRSIAFNDLLVLIDSTPNLKSLKMVVCFNLMVLSLSDDKDYLKLFEKGYGCYKCSYGSDYGATALKYKTQLKEFFPLIVNSFKTKQLKLENLKLIHICRPMALASYGSDAINGSDVINNVTDSSLSSFSNQIIQLIQSIKNLKTLKIKGIKNTYLFNQIKSNLTNIKFQ